MLTLTVGATEVFDEETDMFSSTGGVELQLEHSLLSLSKWEAKHEKPFLGDSQHSGEDILSYIECMLVCEKPPGNFLEKLSEENFAAVHAYIEAKHSATWFSEIEPKTRNTETITSELIYYWMTVFQIPFECERWHLNRLFTLIRICNIKQQKPKKMSRQEMAQRNRELNARRREQMGTKG